MEWIQKVYKNHNKFENLSLWILEHFTHQIQDIQGNEGVSRTGEVTTTSHPLWPLMLLDLSDGLSGVINVCAKCHLLQSPVPCYFDGCCNVTD